MGDKFLALQLLLLLLLYNNAYVEKIIVYLIICFVWTKLQFLQRK